MSLKGTAESQFLLKGAINTSRTVTVTAYEIALQNGFKGTEKEWLESLRGSDADIEVDNLSELHAWTKYALGGTVTEEEVTNVQLCWALKSGSFKPVSYADSYEIGDDGITLVNPTTITLGSDTESRNAIKGKYVKAGVVYYIPADARVAYGNYTTNQTIEADKATKLTYVGAEDSFVGIVVSEVSTAYPQNGTQGGYRYVYNGTLDSSGGVPVLQSKSVTPSVSQQVVKADSSYDGLSQVTVAGDSDLVASNIKKGVNIFGVSGSYEGSGSATLPTLTDPGSASDLVIGKQMIDGNGNVVTGTHECEEGIIPSGTKTITTNGTHNVAAYEFAQVEVAGGGDIVYGEDIEADSLSELHTWNKYTIGGTVSETLYDTVYVDMAQKGSVDGRVYYADEYSVADGELKLTNPALIDLYNVIQAEREVILGKHINMVKSGGYYLVPSNATITASKPSVGYHYISIAPVYKLSYSGAEGSFVSIVVSEDINAYPQNGEQGGYKYVYNGTLDGSGGGFTVTDDGAGNVTITSSAITDNNGNVVIA